MLRRAVTGVIERAGWRTGVPPVWRGSGDLVWNPVAARQWLAEGENASESKAADKSVRPALSIPLDHNVSGQQLPFILGEDGGPFDYVAQLADVARPNMLQQLEGGFRT